MSSVTDDILHKAFAPFGKIEHCFVVANVHNSCSSGGYGFVTFKDKGVAEDAIAFCNDNLLLLTTTPVPVRVRLARSTNEGLLMRRKCMCT